MEDSFGRIVTRRNEQERHLPLLLLTRRLLFRCRLHLNANKVGVTQDFCHELSYPRSPRVADRFPISVEQLLVISPQLWWQLGFYLARKFLPNNLVLGC